MNIFHGNSFTSCLTRPVDKDVIFNFSLNQPLGQIAWHSQPCPKSCDGHSCIGNSQGPIPVTHSFIVDITDSYQKK